jgi:chaperonin GroES
MKIVGPRVLVRPLEAPKPKSSLLFIPETIEAEPSQFALVLAVGNGYMKKDGTREPLDVTVGDTVIVKKYSMNGIEVAGEQCAIVAHPDVLATVDLNG